MMKIFVWAAFIVLFVNAAVKDDLMTKVPVIVQSFRGTEISSIPAYILVILILQTLVEDSITFSSNP